MKNKKKIILATAAAAVLVALAVGVYAFVTRGKDDRQLAALPLSGAKFDAGESPAHLIAHRGYTLAAPENTLPALIAAGQKQYRYVAFDVRETLDGVLVLMRDETVDRSTNGKGKVSRLTLFELLEFDIDTAGKQEEYGELKIPTVEQALDVCTNYGLAAFIEVRQVGPQGLRNLMKYLDERNLSYACIVVSSNIEDLNEIKKINPKAGLCFLDEEIDEKTAQACRKAGMKYAFDSAEKSSTPERIKQMMRDDTALELVCSSVNDLDTLKKMHSAGVRFFMTDCIVPG